MLKKVVSWTFGLFVVSIPLVQPLEFPVLGLGAQLADLIFAFTALLAVIAVLRRDLSLNWSPSYVYIFLYAGTFVLASFFADEPMRSLGRLAILLYLIAITVLTSSLSAGESRRRNIVLGLVIGTALTSLGTIVGIALFYAGLTSPDENFLLSPTGTLPAGNYPRIHSLFVNANMMCNYLNVGIVAIFLARKSGWISRNLFVVLAAGAWLAAIATLSPGIGGIVLSSGLWFWYLNRSTNRRFCAGVLYASIAAAVFFLAVTLITLDSPNTDQDFRVPVVGANVEPSVRV